MSIIGCDLHTRYLLIAMLNSETVELMTRRLQHENGEARAFYASLPAPALVGILKIPAKDESRQRRWISSRCSILGEPFAASRVEITPRSRGSPLTPLPARPG